MPFGGTDMEQLALQLTGKTVHLVLRNIEIL